MTGLDDRTRIAKRLKQEVKEAQRLLFPVRLRSKEVEIIMPKKG